MRMPRCSSAIIGGLRHRATLFVADTSGATAIEYGLIASLICVAIIGSITYFGSQLSSQWLYVSNLVNPQLNH